MHDIQAGVDPRGIEIDEVGISGLSQPTCWDDGMLSFTGIATVTCFVRLPADRRGTHMSRMVEIAMEHLETLDPRDLPRILKAAAGHLDVDSVTLSVDLPFVTKVIAPATQREGWQPHQVTAGGAFENGTVSTHVTVASDVTSLCPCSKAISDYGAHNQRSRVSLTIRGVGDDPYPLPISDMVAVIRDSGSCPVYPLIKRPDERVVTMQAFDNPVFVEDIVRNVSDVCRRRNLRHTVAVRNIESIHSHDAIARISG